MFQIAPLSPLRSSLSAGTPWQPLWAWQIVWNRPNRCAGARVGRPRWLRILLITAGYSMAAMISNLPPQLEQRLMSKTRFSKRARLRHDGAPCACASSAEGVGCLLYPVSFLRRFSTCGGTAALARPMEIVRTQVRSPPRAIGIRSNGLRNNGRYPLHTQQRGAPHKHKSVAVPLRYHSKCLEK